MPGKNQAVVLQAERDQGAFALERFLPYRLSIASEAVSAALARLYSERFGLTVPQWRIIAVLGRFQPLSANQICDKTLMDKVTVSRAVTPLLRRQLLTAQVDARDRRRQFLRLTAKGAAIHRHVVPLAQAYERELYGELEPGQATALDAALAALTKKSLKA